MWNGVHPREFVFLRNHSLSLVISGIQTHSDASWAPMMAFLFLSHSAVIAGLWPWSLMIWSASEYKPTQVNSVPHGRPWWIHFIPCPKLHFAALANLCYLLVKEAPGTGSGMDRLLVLNFFDQLWSVGAVLDIQEREALTIFIAEQTQATQKKINSRDPFY